MTVSVREVVWDALEDILNRSSEEPVQPEDAQAGIRGLNDMMSMEAALGTDLGFTRVTTLADIVTVADGAIVWVKAKLAIYLAGKFKVPVPESVVKKEAEGRQAALNLAVSIRPMVFPSILPVGSGNQSRARDNAFYPGPESGINSEVNGQVLVEDDT